MALPADGQNANGLTKVTQIPAGKELMFIDPTTNEGGIITLEDLTKQILNGLASQAFALDAGQMTLPAALNYLYGNKLFTRYVEFKENVNTTLTISKTSAYSTAIIIISNNNSLFFYIDSTFSGEKIKDNPSCTVERINNSNFKITQKGYGMGLILSGEPFNYTIAE